MKAMEWVTESTPTLKEMVAHLESEVTALKEELEQKQVLLMHLQGLIALNKSPHDVPHDHNDSQRIAVYRYSVSDAIDEVLRVAPEPMNAAAIHELIKDYEVFQGVADLIKSIWNALARGCRTSRYKKEGRGLYSKV